MLDKNRPFVTIYGDTETGHRFEQDGIYYGGDGMPTKKQSAEGKKALAEKTKQLEAELKAARAAQAELEKAEK